VHSAAVHSAAENFDADADASMLKRAGEKVKKNQLLM
jgi:hypothetical protein